MAGYVINMGAAAAAGPLANADRFGSGLQELIKLVQETVRIKSRMEKGALLEEYLAEALPEVPAAQIRAALGSMKAGADRMYVARKHSIGQPEVRTILNGALQNFHSQEQAQYLQKLLEALAKANTIQQLDEKNAARLKVLAEAEEVSEEDGQYLLEQMVKRLDSDSRLLSIEAFGAMKISVQEIAKQGVEVTVETGRQAVLAQAAALFLLQYTTGTPKPAGQDISGMTPYELGILSAAAAESSKEMVLYCAGKVPKEAWVHKLQQLYLKSLTFVSEDILTRLSSGNGVPATLAAVPEVFSRLESLLILFPTRNQLAKVAIASCLMKGKDAYEEAEGAVIRLAGELDILWQIMGEYWHKITHMRERLERFPLYDGGGESAGGSPENRQINTQQAPCPPHVTRRLPPS